MLNGTYQDLFPAIADYAAALTGLLFVAMTVAARHNPCEQSVRSAVERAAAATNLALGRTVLTNLSGPGRVKWRHLGVMTWQNSTARSLSNGRIPATAIPS